MIDYCEWLIDLLDKPLKRKPYTLICSSSQILQILKEENITHYNKTIDKRLNISKDNADGYCCMIYGTQIHQQRMLK